MNILNYYKKRGESGGGASKCVCVCEHVNCFMMSRSAWGEMCIRAGVCTGVTTAIRKLCSFVMGRGADVTHLPKAWPHAHTRTNDTGNIWMFTLLANVSGFPVEKREFEKRNFIKRQPWWYFYAGYKQNLKSTIEHLYGLVARGAITDLTEQKHLYAHLFSFGFASQNSRLFRASQKRTLARPTFPFLSDH